MSLLALLLVIGLIAGCVMMAMPAEKKPAPIALFRAVKNPRAADILLYSGNAYELKCTQDGETAQLEKGSWRQEGASGTDGTVLFLVSDEGKERQMVFERGILHTFREQEGVNPALSIALLDFERKV